MIYERRVQFYETDAQGIVHHSNYFRYFEEARGEFLRRLGYPYRKLREKGYEVVLLEAQATFKRPLLYDEVIRIILNLEHMNRFTFSFSYKIEAKGQLRARAYTKHCILKNGRLVSIPEDIKALLLTESRP